MQQDQLQLRITLTRPNHQQVKVLDSKGFVREHITARTALFRAHSSDYEWDGKPGKRIKAMRSLRPDRPYISCWRNRGDGAAVLPPGLDYWKNVA